MEVTLNNTQKVLVVLNIWVYTVRIQDAKTEIPG
jgi:hypothetical protein